MYKVGDKFTRDEWDKLVNRGSKRFVKHTLKDNEKVYIDYASDMPRTKFKKNFPNNKIVYDPNEADVFIAAEDIMYTPYASIFYPGAPSWTQLSEIVIGNELDFVNKQVKRSVMFKSDKPLIRDTDILYKGELPREMTDGEYESIVKMTSAADSEMINLGMDILLGFDHTINEKKYVLILAQIKHPYYIKKSRTYKTIARILKQKYVNLR